MKEHDNTFFIPPDVARSVRFHITTSQPCPYLPDRKERKIFANLTGTNSVELNDSLTRVGFRRSQIIAYRPACVACQQCKSVRIDVRQFKWSKRWRRVLSKNDDLARTPCPKTASNEQFRLMKRYLNSRHDNGGMNDMSMRDYIGMVDASPVRTVVFEYRQPAMYASDDGILTGTSLSDVLRDGLSMVYSFYSPDEKARGLGTFMVLDHIRLAQELDLPYVYLGYWVKNSEKMGYKSNYKPLEVCEGDVWRPLLDDEC
ncbi:arginyltransferase [Hirschia baltica]|uniref:Aspartate/glutamate leucyltransferase n=1 Tax=Hirschia baltica (strain ATCC 49814 / DSM 5838 / IFAM 1418) TaxID=582402 RepID=C6XIV0_HIRBI|nr:arginyltransferase [Hirschia baltica]ACT59045.1 Arginyltransferase [Hirschia baltica ATCC 49814]